MIGEKGDGFPKVEFAEILPRNATTERLEKKRKEEEDQRKAKEDAVSARYNPISDPYLDRFTHPSLSCVLVTTAKGEGRQREKAQAA
jgi:hypothetical protein